jgi:hypothetical protein
MMKGGAGGLGGSESKKGMHVGIGPVSLGEQLSQTQLHRFFSVVDFRSRFFRRVIAERSSPVVPHCRVHILRLYGVSRKSRPRNTSSYIAIIELDVACLVRRAAARLADQHCHLEFTIAKLCSFIR